MLPSEILEKAAEELEKHGWTKGHFGTAKGPKCASGAIRFVSTGRPSNYPWNSREASQALLELERSLPQMGHSTLVSWNDAPRRTAKQVIELFRKTARRLKREGR
jgi:hypothetical protein